MCSGDELILEQITNQLAKLVDVRDIKILEPDNSVCHELMMIKVAAKPEQRQGVVQTHRQFDGLGVDVAGKTGTAEVTVYHPNHGMFVGYAPASDPEYAIAVRIENGYTSGNACLAADDIF